MRQIADVAAVEQTCRQAAEHGLGWLATDEPLGTDGDAKLGEGEGGSRAVSLQLDARLVEQLPGLLRVYVGAASAAYGDYRNADLIKIHIGSGKLTMMRFDDFDDAPLPRMLERVKIKLREQDVEVYHYGEDYEPPYLYWKSRYINEEHPRYPEQLAFDEALDALGLFDLSGYGPSPGDFGQTLARHRWEINDFALVRSKSIPNLNDACGRFLIFRDLIEGGETQAQYVQQVVVLAARIVRLRVGQASARFQHIDRGAGAHFVAGFGSFQSHLRRGHRLLQCGHACHFAGDAKVRIASIAFLTFPRRTASASGAATNGAAGGPPISVPRTSEDKPRALPESATLRRNCLR